MISVQCPKCGKVIQVEAQYAGKQGTCQGCGGPITVPNAAPAQEASTSFDDLWDDQAEAVTQQQVQAAGETPPSEEKLEGNVPLQGVDVGEVSAPLTERPSMEAPKAPEPINPATGLPDVPDHILRRHENYKKRQKRNKILFIVLILVIACAVGGAWVAYHSMMENRPEPSLPPAETFSDTQALEQELQS